jgi:hypothetical protein
MDVELDAAPKALNRRHRPAAPIDDTPSPPAPALEAEERPGVDREHGAAEGVVPGQAIAERVRQREHPLADGYMRQDVVDEFRGTRGHPPTATAWTKPASLTGEGYERLGMTTPALKTREAPGPDPAV